LLNGEWGDSARLSNTPCFSGFKFYQLLDGLSFHQLLDGRSGSSEASRAMNLPINHNPLITLVFLKLFFNLCSALLAQRLSVIAKTGERESAHKQLRFDSQSCCCHGSSLFILAPPIVIHSLTSPLALPSSSSRT
jgi:hypothetical protein